MKNVPASAAGRILLLNDLKSFLMPFFVSPALRRMIPLGKELDLKRTRMPHTHAGGK